MKKNTIHDANKLALKQGGKCLSTRYMSAKKNLIWECKIKHKWSATYDSIQRGSWCYKCYCIKSNRKPDGYWTIDKCKTEALKFDTRNDFKNGSPSAYQAAFKKTFLDEICVHMKQVLRKKNTLNKEICRVICLKYKTRQELREKDSSVSSKVYEEGWAEELLGHMERIGNKYKRAIYAFEFFDNTVYVGLTYNYEQRLQSHKTSGIIFFKQSTKYRMIKFNEWLEPALAVQQEYAILNDYIKKGWIPLNKSKTGGLGGANLYWTKERCKEEARNYINRIDFIRNFPGAYDRIKNEGWEKEIFAHMVPVNSSNIKWTEEKCLLIAKKYSSRSDFSCGSPYVYSICCKNNWLKQACAHMKLKIKPSGYYSKARCLELAKKCNTREEFRTHHASAYSIAYAKGWFLECTKHMKYDCLPRNSWTKKLILEEAKKYKFRTEFRRKSSGAFGAAEKLGITDIACSHMPKRKKRIYKILA